MRIVFMGTPEFAARALAALLGTPHQVVAVYTQPPRPAGRGQAPRPSAVQLLAESRDLPVFCPESLRDPAQQAAFAALQADVAVVAAYGLILPPEVLSAPKHGCLNIHASLLPRWRGAAPIQRAILAGDKETGITIMQMDAGLDTGPILASEPITIGPATTCAELHDRLAVLGARMIVYVLNGIEAGLLQATPQPEEGVIYAAKLTREEGRLDWRDSARALERRIRAFTPWPGAWFDWEGTRIKVLEGRVMVPTSLAPGTVADDRLTIACGEGSLRILRLQREGRKAQNAAEFLRGFPLAAGTRLPVPDTPSPRACSS